MGVRKREEEEDAWDATPEAHVPSKPRPASLEPADFPPGPLMSSDLSLEILALRVPSCVAMAIYHCGRGVQCEPYFIKEPSLHSLIHVHDNWWPYSFLPA
jgi:hypothetical protein